GITEPMRGKEETADYRYFPEPDIPPIVIDKKWINEIENNMPSLPIERMNTLKVAGVGIQEATTIVERPDLYAYFDECLKYHDNKRSLVNWIIGELNAIAQKKGIDYSDIPVRPKHLAELVRTVDEGKVGASAGKEVLLKMWETGKSPDELISEMGVERISDEDTIRTIINEVVGENPEVVASILKGKDKAIGRLIGEVMRKSGGSADPSIVKKLLSEKIEKMKEVN
ncbi:MAG TPA: Asp-tRNA(Asn)/Glu-tRNA(Gln) amidotransferase GatCAB subunit B, partial [Firmicutes bacterium]|nr:Asp-tRNA(Asn)/Glu-tRNA(Gln) amidotransferase GatCAB subunit B [Bacillota bacterium]